MQRPFCLFVAFCLLTAVAGNCFAGDDLSLPEPATDPPTPFLEIPLRMFQTLISPIDGDRCPMHPSCSAYAKRAVQKHGPLMGWVMACDRLLRCGRDECQRSARVRVNGRPKCNDPVTHNDFWW